MLFYLDSMVWIYALEGDPVFGGAAQRLLHNIRIDRHTLLTSYFLLGEITVLPARRQDAFTIASYRRLLLASPAVEVVPFEGEASSHFATLRANLRTKPADSIHLALAASAKADVFVTGDVRLQNLSIASIGRIQTL
jgi:predicted nucleic acid-binding protein